MKVKTIKYESEVLDRGTTCTVQTDECDGRDMLHVCFDDGSGAYVCTSCFEKRINDGFWITDSAEHLKAS